MQFNSRVYFHLALYMILISVENARNCNLYTAFRLFQEWVIYKTIKISKPLVYSVLVYYLLKNLTEADML